MRDPLLLLQLLCADRNRTVDAFLAIVFLSLTR